MAEKTGGMSAEDRERMADIPTSMKKSDMPWYQDKEDADRMRAEVRSLEEDLVANVAALRYKLSMSTLKARAKEEFHELAVNKPKAALSTAGQTGGDYLRKFLNMSKDQPIIPVAISTVFVALAAIRRMVRER